MYVLTEEGHDRHAETFASLREARAAMARSIRKRMPELGIDPDEFDRLARENADDPDGFVSPRCRWRIHRLNGTFVTERTRQALLEMVREMTDDERRRVDAATMRWLEETLAPDNDTEPPLDWERDYYVVNEDRTVTLLGWVEARDNHYDGFEYDVMPRHTVVYGDWPDTYDMSGIEMTDWAAPHRQYNEDAHFEDVPDLVAQLFGPEGFEHLPMTHVGALTRPGRYWCRFDEEPGRQNRQEMEEDEMEYMEFGQFDTEDVRSYLEGRYDESDKDALIDDFGTPNDDPWGDFENERLTTEELVARRDRYIDGIIKAICASDRFAQMLSTALSAARYAQGYDMLCATVRDFEEELQEESRRRQTPAQGNVHRKERIMNDTAESITLHRLTKSDDDTIGRFATVKEAEEAMAEHAWDYAREHGLDNECVHNGIDQLGMPYMYVDGGKGPEYRIVDESRDASPADQPR